MITYTYWPKKKRQTLLLYLEIDLCGARKRQHYEHDEDVDEVVVIAEVQLDTADSFQRPRRRNNATYRQRSETHSAKQNDTNNA